MVECGVCYEEYQEGHLELHRQMCVVLLMFRCSLCDGDYVSKEGLWNHLDLHEIVDESKELHYQEIKAKHKLHQCVLCNDQRAYSESCYWKHVHDVHDGFFLRCFDCGENFRSEQSKNDHCSSHCRARNETVVSNFNALEEELVSVEENMTSDHLKQSLEERSSINEELDNLPSQFACDVCGVTFSSNSLLLRHKKTKYTCLEGGLHKCPHCRRVFRIKEYQAHIPLCEMRKFSCELCPMKFRTSVYLARHMRSIHRGKRVIKNAKQAQNQAKNITSSLTSSCSSNVDDEDRTGKKDSRSSGTSSDTKCSLCGKECAKASYLRQHIGQIHQPTTCNICGITFEGSGKARYHKIKKHSKPKIECAKCSKKFFFKEYYDRHLKVCDPVLSDPSSDENSVELNLEERDDPKVFSENPSCEPVGIKCSHCGAYESSAVTLARHILIHHDPVACDFCGITLSSFSKAQHHMKKKHKVPKFKCPHCLMQFCGTERLKNHVAHCEKEKVPCDFCGKMFKNLFAANKHRRTVCRAYKSSKEQERKNDETNLCDETDSSTSTIKEKKILPTPAVCNYCNEEFSSAGYLINHLKMSHELTKCDICGITVIGISGSKQHKIKYHVEPKHECPNCGKKFHRKVKFNAHCFACEHKRYSCKLCGRTFKQLHSVKKHNKLYHPDEGNMNNIQIIKEQNQDQNNDLKKEITAEEATISARDDQGQSTIPLANKDKESRSGMPSVAPLNGTSEKQVVLGKTTQSLVGNLSGKRYSCKRYSCNICGVNFQSYSTLRNHKLTKHTEAKFPCPHCPRKFHHIRVLEKHASSCADLKFSCELCGRKFNLQRKVRNHKKRLHRSNSHLSNENIQGEDCTEEQQQNSVEQLGAVQETNSCIICRTTFVGTDELMEHKLSCSKFSAKETLRLPVVKEAQTNSTIVPQEETIDLKLEIKVEETMLQEQWYQVPNEDPAKSFTRTVNPQDSEAEDAKDLKNVIKVKEECLEDEDEIITEHQQSTKDSTKCLEVPSDRNKSAERHKVMDVHSKEAKKKSHSQRRELTSNGTKPRSSKRIRLKGKN